MGESHNLTLGRTNAMAPAAAAEWATRIRRWATSGLAWGTIACIALTAWILFGLGGADYYRTPLDVRAYAPAHRLLRPSGPFGQTFGLVGTVLMLVPFAYMARKRIRGLKTTGTLTGWLEVHLFCGIVGPLLVTFHTSFKFNGIISAAYWSMITVMLSGFVGRFLFVRIPRSIRGNELTRAELDVRAAQLQDEIVASVGDETLMHKIEAFEEHIAPRADARLSFLDLVFGELRLGRRLRAFDRALQNNGVPETLREDITRLATERSLVLRRAVYLQRTKKLFELWHVFHLPLVYLLLAIAAAHIALALYMGYVPFRWS
jgi:hypothetical protein